ncbi:hypothetical protein U3516DRAFT_756443 [Neocallimastix sp. 'constans']
MEKNQENEISKTNRGKEQIILNREYNDKSRRKQLPPDLTTFDEIPNKSKCYKAKKE